MATGCPLSAQADRRFRRRRFDGESYSTTDWPHAGVDFTGKRVALIGTGSSGIQVATEISKQAEQLHVLQRTASHSMPTHNRPLEADEIAHTKASYAELRASRGDPGGRALGQTRPRRAHEVSAVGRARPPIGRSTTLAARFVTLAVYDDILSIPRPTAPQRTSSPTGFATSCATRRWPSSSCRAAIPSAPGALHRQRLLRDLQPAQRDARRHRCRPDRARSRPSGIDTESASYAVDAIVLRDRLRRPDRRAPRHRHRRPEATRSARPGPTAPAPTSA